MKVLKLIGGFGLLSFIGSLMACGAADLIEAFDAEAQLAEDIEIIEQYLADKGYTEYDTLESEVRVVILDEGDGESIEYNDIIQYDYIGTFANDSLFDTSIAKLSYNQDTLTATYLELAKDDDELPILDVNGLQELDTVAYPDYYLPVYSSLRTYISFITTHSQGGWFIQQEGSIQGFKDGTHQILDNVNLGGRGLMLIPSSLAYGRTGTFLIDPNIVILFEIRPVRKR